MHVYVCVHVCVCIPLCDTHQLAIHACFALVQTSPASLQEIREDVREECEKFGPVRKIMVFDVSVSFFVVSERRKYITTHTSTVACYSVHVSFLL